MLHMDLDNRPVALVTGASSGIGLQTARRLRHDGYDVVLSSRDSRGGGADTAADVGGAFVAADVGNAEQARGLVSRVVEERGRLDVLVSCAGTTRRIPHPDLTAATEDVWRRVLDVNLIGPFVLVTAAAPHLSRSGNGCVVNVSSVAGSRPLGSSIPYAVSKAALDHQTRLLAKALGPAIRVNAVAPGLVETPWTADDPAQHEHVARTAPLRRVGTPDDVAEAVLALVRSRYVTGQVLVVDGGLSLVS